MSADAPVTFKLEADGTGWIVFDDPGARANIMNPATQAALADAIDRVAGLPVKALIVVSRKERIFIAGADLGWLASFADAESAAEFSRTGQRLFARLQETKVPVVCAIGGACVGGGYELALACDWRIASDVPTVRIGLPETSLGTIPGWGGCVRLPPLIGAGAALEHILQARLLPADEALRSGLIDEVVRAPDLAERARAVALKLASTGRPQRSAPPAASREAFAEKRKAILARTHGQQPALLAAVDVVEQSAMRPMPQAFEIEARSFGEVTAGEVCKAMLYAFRVRDAAKKRTLAGWFPSTSRELPPIERVGVVGAGVMGSGLAQLLAMHGHSVVVRETDQATLARGLDLARDLMRAAVQRKKLTSEDGEAALGRIHGTTAWSEFADCDLVIEAVVEDIAIKRPVFSELAKVVRPDALLASNTSALPIEEIAGDIENPARTLGLHFFNPVGRMSLVELILGRHTDAAAAERALNFVKRLGKLPVICRSAPGFLVTRVLFFYLNAAVRQWEQGAPAASMETALRMFGWPMGPLRLIDEVGLDVTQSIFGELAHYFPGRFTPSTACARLVAAGLKGRKNGASAGFYRYDDGGEQLNEDAARRVTGRGEAGASAGAECVPQLMGVMVDEARRCLEEGVVRSPEDVDFALLDGAGFPVFRGGLCRYAERTGDVGPGHAIPHLRSNEPAPISGEKP